MAHTTPREAILERYWAEIILPPQEAAVGDQPVQWQRRPAAVKAADKIKTQAVADSTFEEPAQECPPKRQRT